MGNYNCNFNPCAFIKYRPNPVEGECRLITIQAIRLNSLKYSFYVLMCFVLIGIPYVICIWDCAFERLIYYDFCHLNQATHFYIENYDGQHTIVEKKQGLIFTDHKTYKDRVYFVNRYMKYYYKEEDRYFTALNFDYQPRLTQLLESQNITLQGYSNQFASQLKTCFGKCAIEIEPPPFHFLFFREVLQPYYIFLLFNIVTQYIYIYVEYSSIYLFVSVLSIMVSVYQVMTQNQKIYKLSYLETEVQLLRQNSIIETSSLNIVPGDIIVLNKPCKLAFDGILLNGSIVMNQSSFTGECMSILKKGILDMKRIENFENSNLYEGTNFKLITSHGNSKINEKLQNYGVLLMVTKTNFSTMKGQLARIMAYQKPIESKFQMEAAKLILVLFIITLVTFLALIRFSYEYTRDVGQLVLSFFNSITIMIAPAIPISFNISNWITLYRLRSEDIVCVSPSKIAITGRVETVYFDKTGTLTTKNMTFEEFLPSHKGKFMIPITLDNRDEYVKDNIRTSRELLLAFGNFGSCHMLSQRELQEDDQEEQRMEIELFKRLAKFNMVKAGEDGEGIFAFKGENIEGTVIKKFEFNSDIKRMTAISVTSFCKKGEALVFSLGSPQDMVHIIKKQTIPNNYFDELKKYTKKGYRVLSIASKSIRVDRVDFMKRQEAEANLQFNGFQIFKNPIKPQSFQAIQSLRRAQINTYLLSGDNINTSIYVAIKTGMVPKGFRMLQCELVNGDMITAKQVESSELVYLDNTSRQFITETQLERYDIQAKVNDFVRKILPIIRNNFYVYLGMTAEVFNKIWEKGTTNIELKFLFQRIIVIARCKPIDKTNIIKISQSFGIITGMCGEGANDYGALKEADAGLSICRGQASITSAFSCKSDNILSMVTVIRECRSGLSNLYYLFRMIISYCFIEYTTTLILLCYHSQMSNYEYLYIDIAHNFLYFFTISFNDTHNELTEHKPQQVLFTLSNFTTLLYIILMQLGGQILIVKSLAFDNFQISLAYKQYSGFSNNLTLMNSQKQLISTNAETTALFIFSLFIYTATMLTSATNNWKQPFYTNLQFMIITLCIFIYDVLICFCPAVRASSLGISEVQYPFDVRFQVYLFIVSVSIGVLIYVGSTMVIEKMFDELKKKYPEIWWL